jgi:hypothetical protein
MEYDNNHFIIASRTYSLQPFVYLLHKPTYPAADPINSYSAPGADRSHRSQRERARRRGRATTSTGGMFGSDRPAQLGDRDRSYRSLALASVHNGLARSRPSRSSGRQAICGHERGLGRAAQPAEQPKRARGTSYHAGRRGRPNSVPFFFLLLLLPLYLIVCLDGLQN